MKKYSSLKEVALDLKKNDLERKIAREELMLSYNTLGKRFTTGLISNTVIEFGKSLITKYIVKRFF